MKKIANPKSVCLLAHREAGLSLVELMISITIGLILLAGISMLIAKESNSRAELEKSSRQIENGRYAVELLREDIQHAGYYGDYAVPVAGVNYTSTTLNPCSTDSTNPANLGWTVPNTVPVPVFGYAGAAAKPGCLDNPAPGTAALVIRRTATVPTSLAAAEEEATYLQVSRCNSEATPFLLGRPDTINFNLHQNGCVAVAPLHGYIVRIYYISSCDVCGTDTIPTLKMWEFTEEDDDGRNRSLVEGIENMQFDYGIDSDGDGSPDSYTVAPTNAEWPNVMAVRVNLLARNNDSTPGYDDGKSYTLSGESGVPAVVVGPFHDNFKRHAYGEVVRVINPSGRREQ